LRLQSNKSKEEQNRKRKKNGTDIPEETAAEPLNDEALETVSGGRRLENSLDLNNKKRI